MLLTHIRTRFSWLALALLTSACSSNIPLEIREAPEDSPSVSQVRDQPDQYHSKTVRWGGRILKTVNDKDASRMTIVTFPLTDDGRPRTSKNSTGRFIATSDQFLEPLEYKAERLITITGHLTGTETSDIGEYPYAYPVVKIEHSYLWPEPVKQYYQPHPFYWGVGWYHHRHYRRAPAISAIVRN